jgi:hypothetical protein
MEVEIFCRTLVNFYRTTRCHVLGDSTIQALDVCFRHDSLWANRCCARVVRVRSTYPHGALHIQPLASPSLPRPHVSLCLWVTQLLYNYHSRQLFHFVVLCLWMIKVWELSPVDSEQVQSQILQNRNTLNSLQHADTDSGNFRLKIDHKFVLRFSRLLYPRVGHRIVFWANINVSREHVVAVFSVVVMNVFYCRHDIDGIEWGGSSLCPLSLGPMNMFLVPVPT